MPPIVAPVISDQKTCIWVLLGGNHYQALFFFFVLPFDDYLGKVTISTAIFRSPVYFHDDTPLRAACLFIQTTKPYLYPLEML